MITDWLTDCVWGSNVTIRLYWVWTLILWFGKASCYSIEWNDLLLSSHVERDNLWHFDFRGFRHSFVTDKDPRGRSFSLIVPLVTCLLNNNPSSFDVLSTWATNNQHTWRPVVFQLCSLSRQEVLLFSLMAPFQHVVFSCHRVRWPAHWEHGVVWLVGMLVLPLGVNCITYCAIGTTLCAVYTR